ncbi:hypothetical protein Tco_0981708 [Tanacetum coccineum]
MIAHPYLRKHSSMAEPGTSCCLGLMDAWKDNSDCSDQVFNSIVNLRHVNETRLTHVSSTCGFSDISLDDYLEARVSADQAKTDKDMEDQAYKDVPFVVVVVIVIALIWVSVIVWSMPHTSIGDYPTETITLTDLITNGYRFVLDEFSPAKEFFVWLGSGCLANVVTSFFLYGVSGRMRWSSELVAWLLLSIF